MELDFVSDIVLPDKSREPFFDGREEEACCYRLVCQVCENPIGIDLWDFIDQNWDWMREFDAADLAQIREHYDFKQELAGNVVYLKSELKGNPIIG